jgi:hypothetical protein
MRPIGIPSLIASLLLLALLPATAVLAEVTPRDPSDLISLRGGMFGGVPGCGTWANAFPLDRRLLPDGTEVPFTIPARKTLVVTGIDWMVDSPGALGGGPDTVFLHIGSGSVFTDVAAPGLTSNAVQLSGISIAPGTNICFSKSGPWNFATAFVRGFLVDSRP